MRIVVTGSSGHLGEALVRVLGGEGHDVVGLDVVDSPFTTVTGSITDGACVRRTVEGADAVLHTATLHKPHIGSHARPEFVDTNIVGTLTLLERAVAAGVGRFVFTSTTSAFGRALTPPPGAPAAWVTEDVASAPRNIYGVTKSAAEDVCELISRDHGLPCVVLRTSRFFPEGDDVDEPGTAYADANVKANELLYRRVDLDDVVTAHRLAMERAPMSVSVGTSSLPPPPSNPPTSPGCVPTPQRSFAGTSPSTNRSTPSAGGGCSRPSTASTSTRGHGKYWVGPRGSISGTPSTASAPARIRVVHWPEPWAPRDTTPSRPGRTTHGSRHGHRGVL